MSSASIDPTVSKAMDQLFAEQTAVFRAQQNRATAGDAAVAEILRNTAVQAFSLVGAHAATQLNSGSLPQSILDQRSAAMQPQAAPAQFVPVAVKTS